MKTTDDPKTSVVKVRLNDETKEYIENASKRKHISVSEYIRELIKADKRASQKF